MPSIPIWMQSSDVVNITLTPQTLSAAGALTDTTPVTELDVGWESISENLREVLKEVNYAGSVREHNIKLASTFEYSISYLLTHLASTDPALGKRSFYTSGVFKIVFKYGTSTGSIETCTSYGRIESHSVDAQGRGELVGKLTIKPVDTGSGAYFVRAIT